MRWLLAFPNQVIDIETLVAPDLEAIVGLPQGHIFHGELSADQLFWQRPAAALVRLSNPHCRSVPVWIVHASGRRCLGYSRTQCGTRDSPRLETVHDRGASVPVAAVRLMTPSFKGCSSGARGSSSRAPRFLSGGRRAVSLAATTLIPRARSGSRLLLSRSYQGCRSARD